MTADERPFGFELYEELKSHSQGGVITTTLLYADIQRLKAADRAQTVEIFGGSDSETMRRIQEGSAQEVVGYLVEVAEKAHSGESILDVVGYFGESLLLGLLSGGQ